MSKTFDNISEASATNYLFLFAQRMLALRNESPTPPPLNALGLPCKAMRLLWNWLTAAAEEKQERFVAKAHEKKSIKAMLMPYGSAAKEKADAEKAAEAEAGAEEAAAAAAAAKEEAAAAAAAAAPVEEKAETAPSEKASVECKAAATANATANMSRSSKELPANEGRDKKIAEKITPLAKKIKEYIIDNQDDAAQEDRWRTIMKRDMVKSFRVQREEVQQVKEEVQPMQRRLEEVHSKMDETLQLVKNIADLVKNTSSTSTRQAPEA